ncbi:lipoyl protein ligase domain-containing protein [Nonlabens sp. Asnod3-H03]|uniref:Octanoate-[acyl-carrier-protein]-protein-N-octanoyltransferase n=1 Tax=Nonlabens ulvanivorans TaxID=906888 RepID=A0A081DEX6_NONUL|nr:octanoate-[acyl-carrier-protein]-protein-N-octanoyltransferase [Nonlabens ulvanivorans]
MYTLGESGDLENLLANESLLKNIGATFYKINCGGDITYSWSSTNSMLSYTRPRIFFTDIHKYLSFLEENFIKILADYGLKEKRSDRETGVIAALIILNKNN